MSEPEILTPKIILLHQITYPEVATASKAVVALTGHMVGGPDRRGPAAPPATEVWRAWQRDVQAAERREGAVPQRVMDYFQATKHLISPPKEGVEATIVAPTKPAATPATQAPPPAPAGKRFFTSYSAMQLFEICPRKYAAEKVYKTVPYVESAEAAWGNRVHKAAENYVLNALHAGKLPVEAECLPLVKRYCDFFLASGAELLVEHDVCCTKDLKVCGPKDWDTCWFRGRGDLFAIKDRKLTYVDWKSGKVKEDPFQIEVMVALADLHFGDRFDTADGKFIFVKETDPAKALVGLPRPIEKSDIPAIWEKIFAITNRMEAAWAAGAFQARSNGLCKAWCSVTECAHCGAGRK